MSYRVIIADDEPKIIQLIRLLGQWEKYDIEIIDECRDGSTALESIKKNCPDLVLSDIKMPDIDGLELIRLTREAGIDSLFILISGYRHFEYARSAVELNVVDYLLKPIDEEQLNKTLERALRQLAQSRENKENKEELIKIYAKQNKERMQHFWKDFIFNVAERNERLNANLRSVELCNAEYHTEFLKGCFQVVFMCSNIAGLLAHHGFLLEEEMESRVSRYLKDDAVVYYNVTYMGCIMVLNFQAEKKKIIRESISAFYYSMRDLDEIYGNIRLSFGISSVKNQIKDLKEAYFEAQDAEWGRLITMRDGVLEYSQISGLLRVDDKEILKQQELQSILSCVKYLRREELGAIFREFSERSKLYHNCYPGSIATVYFRILDAFGNTMQDEQLIEKLQYCYIEAKTFMQVIKNVYNVLDQYVEGEQKKSKEKAGKPITEAVWFIRKHYAEPISQEDVARAGNVSVTYLSKLFKEELDIGFNEFLTQIRLEESEKLLADTTMSIKEIATAVGYPDEKYYSKLFKKTTGIKPTEYRKIYG